MINLCLKLNIREEGTNGFRKQGISSLSPICHSPLLTVPFIPIELKTCSWTSLAVQWLRIRLPMQGTRVRALVREDPTCRGATKPVRHNC